jgi:hypothetical protein
MAVMVQQQNRWRETVIGRVKCEVDVRKRRWSKRLASHLTWYPADYKAIPGTLPSCDHTFKQLPSFCWTTSFSLVTNLLKLGLHEKHSAQPLPRVPALHHLGDKLRETTLEASICATLLKSAPRYLTL